jgi:hypothetical protein
MSLKPEQRLTIKNRIKDILKLEDRIREKRQDMLSGDASPFLLVLLGEKLMLQTKVVQSIQTTMGMSFYEQTCKFIGEANGYKVETQKKVKGHMFQDVQQFIENLNNNIGTTFNRTREMEHIRSLCEKNISRDPNISQTKVKEFPDSTVDVYVTTPDGEEFLIDITTVKPNKKEFRVMKEKLLRWACYRMSADPLIKVEPYIAIPYNPEGNSIKDINYNRFGEYYDRQDILVGDELWKKVSGGGCSITDIMEIFTEISLELGETIKRSLKEV